MPVGELSPEIRTVVQTPLTQGSPEQTVPQAPQFLPSVCSLTQAPLQSVVPLAQFRLQAPLTQLGVPVPEVGPGQTLPQAPQLLGSVCSLTQALLQRVKPLLQATPQAATGQETWFTVLLV